MQLAWLVSPITLSALLALALIACLTLFLSTRMQVAIVQRTLDQNREAAEASAAALSAGLTALRQEMEATETAPPTGQELNLTRRAQALRMQRRGEAASTITAALRLPRNEIDLLLKLQKLADTQWAAPDAGRTAPDQSN